MQERTREELLAMSKPDLQKIARELAPAGQKSRIILMSKDDLISLILGEKDLENLFGTPEAPAPTPRETPNAETDPAKVQKIAAELAGLLGNAGLGKAQVEALVDAKLAAPLEAIEKRIEKIQPVPITIVIEKKDGQEKKRDLGKQHRDFPKVLKALRAGVNLCLYGPSGTGKTYIADQAAKALDMPTEIIPLFGQISKADLAGYKDATGTYHPSALHRFMSMEPAALILDEIDAAHSNTMIALNSLLRNRFFNFPEGKIEMPQGNIIIATANTNMTGATMEFTGRNRLDLSTAKRFAFVLIDYDTKLERELAGDKQDWYDRCLALRDKAKQMREPLTVTTDDIVNGARLLACGHSMKEAEEMLIWQGKNELKARLA